MTTADLDAELCLCSLSVTTLIQCFCFHCFFVFNDLPTPTVGLLDWSHALTREYTHYRLGKNLSGSGILSLCSLSALNLNASILKPKMATPAIAVLDFQFAG